MSLQYGPETFCDGPARILSCAENRPRLICVPASQAAHPLAVARAGRLPTPASPSSAREPTALIDTESGNRLRRRSYNNEAERLYALGQE